MGPFAAETADESGQIFPRMKHRLMQKFHTGPLEDWRVRREVGRNAQVAGDGRLLQQSVHGAGIRIGAGCVQPAGRPLEIARNLAAANVGDDVIDGGAAGVPDRAGGIDTECFGDFREPQIRHRREMRSREAGVHARETVAFDQGERDASAFAEMRGGDAGDASADDDDINAEISSKLGISRE
jgi:hypothetical protein